MLFKHELGLSHMVLQVADDLYCFEVKLQYPFCKTFECIYGSYHTHKSVVLFLDKS